jgi:ketosteroid isomerase-like protein
MGIPPSTRAVEGILDASEAIDLKAYLPHVTEDVVIHPPVFVIGPGELRGHEGIRDGLQSLREALGTNRKLQLGERRYFFDRADESKVLVGMEITISDKATGDSFGTQASMVCTVVDGKVSKIESYTTREDGLAQLEDPVPVDV